jgi:hypothetical protein
MSLLGLLEPAAPPDPLDLLLATPTDRTLRDNLPEDITEEFVMAHAVAVDASGPVPSLQGATLAGWQELRRVLALAWSGRARRELPRVCIMGLPWINRERRRRIEALARQWPWDARP